MRPSAKSRGRPAASLPLALTLATSGCPWILGGPDLSHVAASPADTDADADADADADSDADSDADTDGTDSGTVATGTPPLVIDLGLRPFVDKVGFTFVVTDDEDDLLGGYVHLSDGVTTTDLLIPTDLERWDPFGTSSASAPTSIGCAFDYDATWTFSVTDLAGHTTEPVAVPVHVTALGTTPETPATYDLGLVEAPFAVCANYETRFDPEPFKFRVPTTGGYQLHAGWISVPIDVDVYVYQGGNLIGYGVNIGTAFEQILADLDADVEYRVEPTLYDGNGAAPWSSVFLVSPE